MTKLLAAVNKLLEILVISMLALITLLVFVNAMLRYFFGGGIAVAEELVPIVFIWITFLGSILVLNSGEHITVNALVMKLPPKIRAYWSLVIDAALIACSIIILRGGVQLAIQNMDNRMSLTDIPVGMNFVAVAVMAGMFCVILSLRLIAKVLAIRGGMIP